MSVAIRNLQAREAVEWRELIRLDPPTEGGGVAQLAYRDE
jgi:hypothetical protein